MIKIVLFSIVFAINIFAGKNDEISREVTRAFRKFNNMYLGKENCVIKLPPGCHNLDREDLLEGSRYECEYEILTDNIYTNDLFRWNKSTTSVSVHEGFVSFNITKLLSRKRTGTIDEFPSLKIWKCTVIVREPESLQKFYYLWVEKGFPLKSILLVEFSLADLSWLKEFIDEKTAQELGWAS